MLFVAHAWGGGIRQHMTSLAALVAAQCDVLLLEPAGGETVRLSWLRARRRPGGVLHAAGRHAGAGLAAARARSGARCISTMFTACRARPRFAGGRRRAVRLHLARLLRDLPAISSGHRGRPLLRRARRGRVRRLPRAPARRNGRWTSPDGGRRSKRCCAAPNACSHRRTMSNDASRAISRDCPIIVLPHAEAPLQRPRASPAWSRWAGFRRKRACTSSSACAEDARARGLPLSFRVLGAVSEPLPQRPQLPLSVRGEYA